MSNTLKTTALLAALTALVVLIGGYFGGQGGMLLFFGFAIVAVTNGILGMLEKLEMASSVRPLPVGPAVGHMFIVNPLKCVNFAGLFSTHPPLAERIRRLRTMQLAASY